MVADAKFATAPFLHAADEVNLPVIARRKENLPELHAAAQARFANQPPHAVFPVGGDRVELWDADDFDPWESLHWETVRVLRYRQHKPNGTVVEAYWLTNFSQRKLASLGLFHVAKSRWEIENQGFNEAKNLYGTELLILLAIVMERLYRLRYLHRGNHRVPSAIDLLYTLLINLSCPPRQDSS